jgi:ribosomal protein S18 acetylase RimI-like enzyme
MTHLEYDTKSVRKLVKRTLESEFLDMDSAYMKCPGACFWIASLHSEIVGCIGLKPFNHDEAELCRLSVSKTVRRRGIASQLILALETFAYQYGYRSIVLETLGEMEPAKSFYDHHQYVHVQSTRVGKPPSDFVLEKFRKDF